MTAYTLSIDKQRKAQLDDTMQFSLKDWKNAEQEKMQAVNQSHKVERIKHKNEMIAKIFRKETYRNIIDALKIKTHY